MKKLILFLVLLPSLAWQSKSQTNTLFDDTRVSSVWIDLPPDSLEWIYNHVLSDYYFHARFIFDDNARRDTLYDVGFRLRGNTSRYSAKKSFKISFSEYVSGRKYQGVKKINLNGEHNDPTMVREKFFYDLWKKAGFPERRSSFMKVFINGSYYGLYTNLEEMEKEWVSRVYPDNNGNLYKCTYPADLVYHGPDQQTYKDLENSTVTGGRVYDLQTNKTQDDYTRLVALITALNQPVDDRFAAGISQILNVNGFLKAFALDVATGNWDNYAYNRNNFYLYDNPSTGRFEFISYDPDNTVGVDWMGIDWAKRNCLNWPNPSMDLPLVQKLLAVPSFFNQYRQYLAYMANNIINPDSSFARLDFLHMLITPAAINDSYRTYDYGYDISDFHNGFDRPVDSHTPYGIKPFLSTRSTRILEQLYPEAIPENNSTGKIAVLYPNPAYNTLNIRLNTEQEEYLCGRIADPAGRTLMNFSGKSGNGESFQINIADLPAGLYLLQMNINGMIYHSRFIRQQIRQ